MKKKTTNEWKDQIKKKKWWVLTMNEMYHKKQYNVLDHTNVIRPVKRESVQALKLNE